MDIGIQDLDAVLEETLGLGGYDWLSEDTELRGDLDLSLAEGKSFMTTFFDLFEVDPRAFNPALFFKAPPYKLPLWFSALFVAVVCTLLAVKISLIWGGLIVFGLAFFADQFLIEHPAEPKMDISFRHLIAVAKVGYWIDAGAETPSDGDESDLLTFSA